MILPADEFSIAYVCRNLRPLDRKEVFALRPHESDTALAVELNGLCTMKWVFSHETKPTAFLGLFEGWPGVWHLHFLTTPKFPHCVMAFTRFVRKGIIPALFRSGAHRAQVHVLAEYAQARGLLRLLGAKELAVLRHYGRNKEDFVLCQWLREDVADGLNTQGRQRRKSATG